MRGYVEEQLRTVYAAFAQGNVAGVLSPCSDDMIFHVPGTSPLAGDHTRAGFVDLAGRLVRISGGSFREEMVDVLSGETHGAALLLHSLRRNGRPVSYTTVHLWRLRGGRFCEWWELPQDLDAFNAAWS